MGNPIIVPIPNVTCLLDLAGYQVLSYVWSHWPCFTGRETKTQLREHVRKSLWTHCHKLEVPCRSRFLCVGKVLPTPRGRFVSFSKGLGDIQISCWKVLLSILSLLEWKNHWINKGTLCIQWLPKGLSVDLSVLLAEPGVLLSLTHTGLAHGLERIIPFIWAPGSIIRKQQEAAGGSTQTAST